MARERPTSPSSPTRLTRWSSTSVATVSPAAARNKSQVLQRRPGQWQLAPREQLHRPALPADRDPSAPQLWQAITHKFANGSAPHADSRNMIVVGSTIYEADDGGIFRLSNVGSVSQVWDSLNTNLRIGEVYGVAYDPLNKVIMAGLQDVGAAQQRLVDVDNNNVISDAERENWEAVRDGDATTQITVQANASTVYRYSVGISQKSVVRRRYNATNTQTDNTFFDIGGLKGADAKRSDQVIQVLVANAVDPGRFVYGLQGLYESKADDDFKLSLDRIEKSRTPTSSRTGSGTSWRRRTAGGRTGSMCPKCSITAATTTSPSVARLEIWQGPRPRLHDRRRRHHRRHRDGPRGLDAPSPPTARRSTRPSTPGRPGASSVT